jgi:hypothetical protein
MLHHCLAFFMPENLQGGLKYLNSPPGHFLGSKMLQGVRFAKIFIFLKKLVHPIS